MGIFIIQERVQHYVEAHTAQEALDYFLNSPDHIYETTISDRRVFNSNGTEAEIEDI